MGNRKHLEHPSLSLVCAAHRGMGQERPDGRIGFRVAPQEAMEAVKASAQGRVEKAAREKEEAAATHRADLERAQSEHGAQLKALEKERDDLAAKVERAAGCLKAGEELREAR